MRETHKQDMGKMNSTVKAKSHGFAPLVDSGARVLILGSLPGQQSLREQRYYAHPRNVFWRIMGKVLDVDPLDSYQNRCESLQKQGVALWDVLASSVRPGSLDSAIEPTSATENDFAGLLARNHGIKLICFNGKKSRELFDHLVLKFVPAVNACQLVTLPSSSPAHAAMCFEDKVQRWLIIGDYLNANNAGNGDGPELLTIF